jgi:hypothetical protein
MSFEFWIGFVSGFAALMTVTLACALLLARGATQLRGY